MDEMMIRTLCPIERFSNITGYGGTVMKAPKNKLFRIIHFMNSWIYDNCDRTGKNTLEDTPVDRILDTYTLETTVIRITIYYSVFIIQLSTHRLLFRLRYPKRL